MQTFFLNLTRIWESNARIYWSVILGLFCCVALYVAEAVHVQFLVDGLNTRNEAVLRAAIEPFAQSYYIASWVIFILALIWSNIEYFKTKKALGL